MTLATNFFEELVSEVLSAHFATPSFDSYCPSPLLPLTRCSPPNLTNMCGNRELTTLGGPSNPRCGRSWRLGLCCVHSSVRTREQLGLFQDDDNFISLIQRIPCSMFHYWPSICILNTIGIYLYLHHLHFRHTLSLL